MTRSGDIHIHNTGVNVWEEHWEERVENGMRLAMRSLLGRLRKRGHRVWRDPKTAKHYPSLAPDHWLTQKGDLRATVTLGGRHLKIEFYQELNVKNRNGGRYDFDKFARMPRWMQLQCIVEIHAAVGKLQELGYVYRLKDRTATVPTLLQIRDFVSPPNRTGTLARFNESWNFESDWARGGRFKCDETGWPTAEAIGEHSDRDGVPILNGEERYVYHRGNLKRGVVRTNMNGMWSVGDFTYVSSSSLFLCDPTQVPRRFFPHQVNRLRKELQRAVDRQDYRRTQSLARALTHAEAA